MYEARRENEPRNQERLGEDAWAFLQSWYDVTNEDRPLLYILEKILAIGGELPYNARNIEEIVAQLATKELSEESRALLPEILKKLKEADEKHITTAPTERRLNDATRDIINAYAQEMYAQYNTEEHGFDTRRGDIACLIDHICDEERDTCGYIERRKATWPTDIFPTLMKYIQKSRDITQKEGIEDIAQDVVKQVHEQIVRALEKQDVK